MNKFCSSLVILVVALCLVKEQANSEEIKNKNKLIYSPLVADLSEDLIAITTRFTGTEVLLFGATKQALTFHQAFPLENILQLYT